MQHEQLTREILDCAFSVSNELGCGFLEKVYERALIVALAERDILTEAQKEMNVTFHGKPVGLYYADIVVGNLVILEIKATEGFRNEHIAQLLNYLRATGLPIGMLLNFGSPKLQYRRFDNKWS